MEKQDLIKKAINELGIDVPVMATRMVGGRLELHLYGGAVVKYETGALPADEPPGPATAEQNLAKMKISMLRAMAKERGIAGAGKMKKMDLILALARERE